MTDPAENIDNKASLDLEIIASEYKDYEEIYEKIMAYAKLVKDLETYVNNRKV